MRLCSPLTAWILTRVYHVLLRQHIIRTQNRHTKHGMTGPLEVLRRAFDDCLRGTRGIL